MDKSEASDHLKECAHIIKKSDGMFSNRFHVDSKT